MHVFFLPHINFRMCLPRAVKDSKSLLSLHLSLVVSEGPLLKFCSQVLMCGTNNTFLLEDEFLLTLSNLC